MMARRKIDPPNIVDLESERTTHRDTQIGGLNLVVLSDKSYEPTFNITLKNNKI